MCHVAGRVYITSRPSTNVGRRLTTPHNATTHRVRRRSHLNAFCKRSDCVWELATVNVCVCSWFRFSRRLFVEIGMDSARSGNYVAADKPRKWSPVFVHLEMTLGFQSGISIENKFFDSRVCWFLMCYFMWNCILYSRNDKFIRFSFGNHSFWNYK